MSKRPVHRETQAISLSVIVGWLVLGAVLLALWSGISRALDSAHDRPPVSVEEALSGWPLVDDWKFRIGDDPRWSGSQYDDSDWKSVELPHRWYPGEGAGADIGWYRLRIRLAVEQAAQREQLAHLGLQLGSVLSAYEIYAGGGLLGGVGRLPPAPDPVVDYENQRVLSIPLAAIADDGELVLAMRVWAGSAAMMERWGGGPYNGHFRLGRFDDLMTSAVIGEIPGLLLSVICLVFGLYHLYLYSRNRQLDSFLWFGFTAINIGLYGLMLNEWRYYLGWDFVVYKKIEFAAIYLVPPLVLQTVWSLLGEPIGRWLRVYQISFVLLALAFVATPGLDVHVMTLSGWQLWTLPALGLTGWLIWRKAREGHDEGRTIVLGGLIFIAACLHDIGSDLLRLNAERLIPWGFAAFMVAMAVSLGNRFTAMLSRLEEEVAERTAELSEVNRRLAETASIDPLTGLYNRRGLTSEAESEIQRVFRTGRAFSVVLTDVDRFKSINDRYGHACGDHVLTRVAAKLREQVRDVDRVARWGGEEFLLLLPETDCEGAAVLAEKLREGVADNLIEFEGQRLQVTMTFGVSSFRKGESLDSCIARADQALYRGKEEGRNKVMIGSYKGLTLVT